MKKIATVVAAASLSLGLAACGLGEPPKTVTVTATDKAPSETSSAAPEPDTESESESAPADPEAEEAKVKDSFTIGDMQYVVTKVETGVPTLSDEYETYTAEGQFVVLHVTATNVSNGPSMVDVYGQLVDSNGKTFNSSDDATMLMSYGELEYVELNPDEETSGILAFDIAADSKPETAIFSDDMMSESTAVAVSIK